MCRKIYQLIYNLKLNWFNSSLSINFFRVLTNDVNDDFVDITKGITKLLFHKSEDIHISEDNRDQPLIKDEFTPNTILYEKTQPLAIKQLFSMLNTQTVISQLNEKVDLISKVNQELLEGILNPEV